MSTGVIQKITNGKIDFIERSVCFEPSLISKNRTLNAIKPSAHTEDGFLYGLAKKAWKWALSFFFEEKNYKGIAAAFDIPSLNQKCHLMALDLKEFSSHLVDALKEDESSSPKILKTLSNIGEVHQNISKDIEPLAVGESKLFMDDTRGNCPFFLIEKIDEGHVNMKLLGRNAGIAEIAEMHEICVAGKSKVPAVLSYSKIPVPFLEKIFENNKIHKDLLERYQNLDPIKHEQLASKTASVIKAFWGVVKEVAKVDKNQSKALFLRLELLTLFEIFKNKSEDHETIEALLRKASQDCLKAYQKGQITIQDLEEAVKEFTHIRASLDAATNERVYIRQPWGISSSSYALNAAHLRPLTRSANAPEIKEVVNRSTLRAPREAPQIFGGTITRETQLDLLSSQLRTSSEIVEMAFTLDMEKLSCLEKNRKRYAIQRLNTLSQQVVEETLREKTLCLDVYEAVVRMTAAVYCLEISIGTDLSTTDKLHVKWRLEDLINSHGGLTGKRLHKLHLRTEPKIEFGDFNRPLGLKDEVAKLRSSSYALQTQFDLLNRLAPSFYLNKFPIQQIPFLNTLMSLAIPQEEDGPTESLWDYNYFGPITLFFSLIANNALPLLPQSLLTIYQSVTDNLIPGQAGTDTVEAMVDDPQRSLDAMVSMHKLIALGWFVPQGEEKAENDFRKKTFYTANPPFQPHELTALHLLVNNNCIPTEILGFLSKEEALLKRPEVRNLVEALLFSPKSIQSIRNNHALQKNLPLVLKKKIEQHYNKRTSPELIAFFIKIYERMRGIYEVESFDPSNPFFLNGLDLLRNLEASFPNSRELAALKLQLLLDRETLSYQEVIEAIIAHTVTKNTSANAFTFDPEMEWWNEQRFASLIARSSEFGKDPDLLSYAADKICSYQNLPLDQSDWKVMGPFILRNDHYEINLIKGEIFDHQSSLRFSKFAQQITTDPLFSKSFPNLDLEKIQVCIQSGTDGTNTYFFKDHQGIECSIIQRGETLSYYKDLPRISNSPIQAVNPPAGPSPKKNSVFSDPGEFSGFSEQIINEIIALFANALEAIDRDGASNTSVGGILTNAFSMLRKALGFDSATPPTLPLIFDNSVFVDPETLQGYSIDPNNNLLFKLQFNKSGEELVLEHVIDCRPSKSSEPSQVMSLKEYGHSEFNKLSSIEDPSRILIWKNKEGISIELTRFGLTFALQNGVLNCTTAGYEGYSVDLSATLNEKQGYSFSLLLKHNSDRSKPAKLILPESALITTVSQAREFASWGALLIHVATKLYEVIISYLFNTVFIPTLPVVRLQIDPTAPQAKCIRVDLRPHTNEILYSSGHPFDDCLELMQHACIQGNYETAAELLDALRLADIKFSKQQLTACMQFLRRCENSGGGAAVVGLRFVAKLRQALKGNPSYMNFCKELKGKVPELGKAYIAHIRGLPGPLQLSSEEFEHLAKTIKKNHPELYQKHFFVYFLDQGQEVKFPTQTKSLGQVLDLYKGEDHLNPVKKASPISDYEAQINSQGPREPSAPFSYNEQGTALLFEETELKDLFNNGILPREVPALSELSEEHLLPKISLLKAEKTRLHKEIKGIVHTSTDPIEQTEIYAKTKKIASNTDLLIALLQDNLEGLQDQGLLPKNADIAALKIALIAYFDSEVRIHLAVVCLKEIQKAKTQCNKLSQAEWKQLSNSLHELLTRKRHYDPAEAPNLLAFEAFRFITFRPLNDQVNQLQVVSQIIENPTGIHQAETGSGKTFVFSVLRALLQPNGTNLVSLMVPTVLFSQTLKILQDYVGDTAKRLIYPLIFNLKMPLVKTTTFYQKNQDGSKTLKEKEESLFKEIYQKLQETILNRGSMLTDYKSIPLLEEKFWSLNQDLIRKRAANEEIKPIQVEHWTYLKKILLLLKEREERLMDEFDERSRPVHRIQTQMTKNLEKPADFIKRCMVQLYQTLKGIQELRLKQNLQADILDQTRNQCIEEAANQILLQLPHQEQKEEMLDYLLGHNDRILNTWNHWMPEEKDILTFFKEQFTTYLPLTLNYAGRSRYLRTGDGSRITPCHGGQPNEGAKFGNLLEEMNNTSQSYLQSQGVLKEELEIWVNNMKEKWSTGSDAARASLQGLFPDLFQTYASNPPIEKLLKIVNSSEETVWQFLIERLGTLTINGPVVSMNPQNAVSMSRTSTAMSATSGSLDALHRQFEIDDSLQGSISQKQEERLRRRTEGQKMLTYDPEEPMQLFQQAVEQNISLCALIDGAGIFREYPSRDVASQLLNTQNALTHAGFHDESGRVVWIKKQGIAPTVPVRKGFYFAEAYTRGIDIQLPADGCGLLTVNDKGTLEDLNQQEGRMRLPSQKIVLASSIYAPKATVDEVITPKKEEEKKRKAGDCYQAKIQEIRDCVRNAARSKYLAIKEFSQALNLFEEWEKSAPEILELFISPAAPNYKEPGSYAQENAALRKLEPPLPILKEIKKYWTEVSKTNQLDTRELDNLNYENEGFQEKLPSEVFRPGKSEHQVEVEDEREEEVEQQTESVEADIDSEIAPATNLAGYPARRFSTRLHSVAETTGRSYDERLYFTETSVPLNRKDRLRPRALFDHSMPPMNVVHVLYKDQQIQGIVLGDTLDDSYSIGNSYGVSECKSFSYDIRHGHIVKHSRGADDCNRFIQDWDFTTLMAQVKFFNGWIEGYSDDELAVLGFWLESTGEIKAMEKHFEAEILVHKSHRGLYRHSQVKGIFDGFS
jgi:hypothetical protein